MPSIQNCSTSPGEARPDDQTIFVVVPPTFTESRQEIVGEAAAMEFCGFEVAVIEREALLTLLMSWLPKVAEMSADLHEQVALARLRRARRGTT